MRTNKHGDRIPKNYCSCGLVVFGNGAWAAHRKKHKRRGDGHRALTRDQFEAARAAGKEKR